MIATLVYEDCLKRPENLIHINYTNCFNTELTKKTVLYID